MKKVNLYKAESKEYYVDALYLISLMCIDYDGFKTVKGLKSLIDDIKKFAEQAEKGENLYIGCEEENDNNK